MSPPLERVGGRGPSERTLLRVVVVVLAAGLLAVVKPWGDGGGTGGGIAPRSAQEAAAPTLAASVGPTPLPTPVDPASTFCLAPSGWRLTSLEVFDRQTIRVWQTIDPVEASGPTDPALPVGLVVSTSVLAVGWCAPTAPDVRPTAPVTTRIWHVPPTGAPVELDLRPRLGPSGLGEDYPAPDVGGGHRRLDAGTVRLRGLGGGAGPVVVVRRDGQAIRPGCTGDPDGRAGLAGTMSRVWTSA